MILAPPGTKPSSELRRVTIAEIGSPGTRRGMMKISVALSQMVKTYNPRRRSKYPRVKPAMICHASLTHERLSASTRRWATGGRSVTGLSPVACRLSPVACRLSPVACRLSPVACRLSPVACRLSPGLPSRRPQVVDDGMRAMPPRLGHDVEVVDRWPPRPVVRIEGHELLGLRQRDGGQVGQPHRGRLDEQALELGIVEPQDAHLI